MLLYSKAERLLLQNSTLMDLRLLANLSFNLRFEDLINQFEATSYGDKLFSNLIVIFLQAAYPPQFKMHLFKEHRMALSFIRLNLTEVFKLDLKF